MIIAFKRFFFVNSFINIISFLAVLELSSGEYIISLVVSNMSGKSKILNPTFLPKPNKISVDGNEKIMNDDGEITVDSDRTTVLLSWNYGFNSFSFMFYGVTSIIIIDLSSFTYRGVEEMIGTFSFCTNLISINFGNFDSSLVTDMFGLFQGDLNLLSLDLSKLDVSRVIDMRYLFGTSGISYASLIF